MPVTQETIILHDFGNTRVSRRRRFTRHRDWHMVAGEKIDASFTTHKDRFTIDIKAEPIVHVFDDVALGAGPAEAIREVIERAIKDIGAMASEATRQYRARAARAFDAGKIYPRYDGARKKDGSYRKNAIGPMRPNKTGRLFNDSAMLSEGLHVRQNPSERSFTTNVPASRLTEQRFVDQLLELVPILKNPARIAADKHVRRAVLEAKRDMIQRATGIADAKRKQLRMAQLNAAKALLGLGRSIVGL